MKLRIGIIAAILVLGSFAGIAVRQAQLERARACRPWGGPMGFDHRLQPGFWTGVVGSDAARYQREITALESVIESLPDYAPAYRELSLAYAFAGSSARAIEAGETYAELEPDDADARFLLASVYSLAGSYDRSLGQLDRVEGEDSLLCWVQKMRGDIFAAKGMHRQSLESYGHFVDLAPYELVRCDGHFYAGSVLIENGRFAEALDAFDRSAPPGCYDSRTHWGKGLAYAAQGRPDLARREAAQIELEDSEGEGLSPGLHEFLVGRILMAEERWEEAADTLEKAARESDVPTKLRCLAALAESCWEAGRAQQARRVLDQCFSVNPLHAEAHYLKSRFLDEEGRVEEAIAGYEAFLDIWRDADPDLQWVVEAKRRVEELRKGETAKGRKGARSTALSADCADFAD